MISLCFCLSPDLDPDLDLDHNPDPDWIIAFNDISII